MELIDITKDGDIVVKAGDDKSAVVVRAHSSYLKSASPVFKAMLEGAFIEGSTSYSIDHPLLLPDDDPQAFLHFCKIIHHQPQNKLPLKVIGALTIFADKYQCVEIIRDHVAATLGGYFDHTIEESLRLPNSIYIGDLVFVAFILGDAQLLWRGTRELCGNHNLEGLGSAVDRRLKEIASVDLIGEYMASSRAYDLD